LICVVGVPIAKSFTVHTGTPGPATNMTRRLHETVQNCMSPAGYAVWRLTSGQQKSGVTVARQARSPVRALARNGSRIALNTTVRRYIIKPYRYCK